ncbi:MAG TPA: ATP-binding protein, partial [Chloroflexota bacterium]
QVLDSLVENAVKYSPDGGEVRVTLRGENGQLNLTVADQGIGIPPGDLGHVFERFRRATNVDDRRFAGMGLGLYVCQQIVDQYGGRIWASSPPRQGTTIHVSLPV